MITEKKQVTITVTEDLQGLQSREILLGLFLI